MTLKPFGRIMSAKSFVLFAASLAALALQAFDTPYLTFRSEASFSLYGSSSRWSSGTLEYATTNPANEESWTVWSGSTISSAQADGQYYIYLRGKGITTFGGAYNSSSPFSLTASKNVYCEGDIETLRGYDGNVPAMGDYCYKYMFYNWSRLASAPTLSATALANSCYQGMFSSCYGLTSAPSLPATTLASYCYQNMFQFCSGLTSAPELPATTLANNCYEGMFSYCTGLKSIPALPATTAASYCYQNMFQNCTSLEVNTDGPGVEWSIPAAVGSGASSWNNNMFASTSGSFVGSPAAGTTYKVASALTYGEMYFVLGADKLSPAFAGSVATWDLGATVKNGASPYSFEHTGGTLPLGLTVSGATLSGTPTTTGSYTFTLTVTDSERHVWDSAVYTVLIMQPLESVPTTFVGVDGLPITTNCLELTSEVATLDEEWYVVNGNLDFGTGGLKVSGNVNLVLADGASATVVGGIKKAGINVAPGNSLTIYGQSEGTGILNASGNAGDSYSAGGAGIGGNDHENCGTVTINGGTINAHGGNYASAGIGGGYYGSGGTVTVNGGIIVATGGSWYGAGIGGGGYGNGGTVVINGGTVTATGGSSSAGTSSGATGIGHGYSYSTVSSGTLTVGAAVSVKAGATENPTAELEHGEGGAIAIGTQRYFYIETLGMTLLDGALDAYTNENKTWDLNETLVGGATPYSFSGTVPAGLALTSGGTLSGAVTTAGTYPFTLTVTDDAEDSKNFVYTLTVTDPDPLSAQTSLGTAKIGKSTNFNLADTISGGVPPYTFAFSGDHASEFSLSGGTLSFLAASAGNYSCAINVTDKLGTTLTPAPVYTVEAAESTGFTDDDPEEPADGDSVDCLTPDGVFQRVCRKLTSSDTVWEDCWYYAEGNVSISGVTVKGKVSLVLCDGAVLTIQGSSSKAGIAVTNDCALTIYGQTAGSGKLNVTGGFYSAGIGGGNNESAGTINIYGGDITATGGFYGSAIGGGQYGNGGTVTINGGVVTAKGYYSSGIGGGYNGTAGGRVVVNGGTVTAIGHTSVSTYYPGIGVYGSTKDQGTLKVGSRIEVKAGNSTTLTEADKLTPDVDGEVSLSTQRYCYIFETVGPTPLMQATSTLAAYSGEEAVFNLAETVSGGTPDYIFEIKEGSSLPAGFTLSGTTLSCVSASVGGTFVLTVKDASSPQQSEDFAYTITVSARPKTITYMDGDTPILGLTPSEYVEGTGATLPTTAPAAPGYEFEGWYLNSGLTGDKVTAIDAEATGPQTFYANWQPIEYTVAYMDGDTQITDQGLTPTTYTVESATLTLPATATKTGKGFYGWYTNSTCTGDAVTTIPAGSAGNKTFWAKWGAVKSMETYVDAGGNAMPAVECAQVASDTTTLETGWYVVKGEVAISGRVTVSGSVNLILADGALLSVVNDVWREAAVNVPEGASLTVYLQTAGANASLSATTTGSSAAGIGGNTSENAGTVTINGGTITATGGQNGAGIGGGNSASGGVVVINGGTVTAKGGQFGAGIGGGYQGNGGTVTINGGSVTAYSVGDYPSGIGMGYYGTSNGSLAVGSNLSVKSGTGSDALGELTVGVNGAVTLDGKRYYVVEPIGPVPLAQTTSAFDAYVNEAFELSLPGTVSGGSGSYSFTLKDSTLPAWLTLTGDTLSGTPTAADSWTFAFTVSDTVETSLEDVDCTYTITAATRPQPIVYMDGSAVMSGLTPSNYIEGVGAVLPDLASKTGYLFLGWYTAANGGDRVYTISTVARGQQTVYAHWTARNYNITYMDGATTMSGLTPTIYDIESATINLPEPLAPEGKVFVGWFTDSGFNTPATTIPHGSIGDKTFYVKWRDAQAGEGEVAVTFIDADGSERTENCKVMTAAMTTLSSGWYAVNNDVTINSCVTIDGDVKIVLVDDATLVVNANGGWAKAGIAVTNGCSLAIYGQTSGTGALIATGGDYGAGIGSGYNKNAGNVTINGGIVTATGHDASGIGGSQSGVCGTVTINRGTVVATGGGMSPGIGSGNNASAGGTVVINGGDVTATGGSLGAAGIGGGNNCPGGVVTITGGTVVAIGTSGAGIGGSGSGAGATVTITGGSVTATAGAAYRYGIGGGNTATDQGSLTVGDGMVVRAGEGENPADELDVDSNGAVTLVAHRYYVVDDGSAPIGPTLYEIQYFDGQYNQIQVEPSKYEAGTVTVLGVPEEKPGYVFVGWYTLPNFNSEKVTQIGANETGVKMFYAKWEKASERAVVNYLDVDGVEKSVECTIISGEKDLLTNGWYAVTNNVTLTHGLGVTNDVRLVIADNVTLTVSNGTFGKAGVHVPSDSFLTIFGQSGDSGVLSVTGGSYAAGIGGDRDEASSGAVTVNGGVVAAQGGSKGAGIGGGNSGSGGAVTINGGTVTATGGNDAAGIGGGYTGSCGAVTINGGTVTANGGASSYDSGAGIGGGGYGGSGGDVVINGGTVTATSGGRYSDGIGSGNGEGTRGTLKVGEGVNVWAGANADSAEELTQKKEDGTFWIFGTYNYYHAETATAESEFNIYYYDSDGETPLDLSPAKYQSGTGLAVLPTPAARAGYTFAGWWTSQWAHLAEPVTEIAPGSTGNVTIYAKWTPNTYTITYVTDPMVIEDLGPVSYTYGVGVAELPEPESSNPYMIFDGWYEDSVKVTSISATAVGDKTLTARWIEDATKVTSVTFVGAEGSQSESCRVLTTDVTEMEDGWYVVNSDLDYGAHGLAVSGDVKLVLADGASLTATAASYSQKAGINVPEGASLTIYAQSEGTGELTVAGDPENLGYAAGIGGNANESCGTVTIYGGIVTASSNDGGAGIGGGYKGHGGTVVVNGGTVTATSGGYGAGIGGGKGTINNGGHGGSVTINGGTVVATADYMAAGIGGGYYGDGGTVTINGGVVTATGGPAESGIGKGAGAETQVVLTAGDGISVFVGDSENPSIDMLETDEYGVVTMPSRPKQYYIVRADSGEPAFEIVDGVLVGANIKGNADIVIPDSVLEIDQRVFEDETALRSVVIPNSVTNIGYSAFDGCTSLTNVTFGMGVKSIGSYAFTGCSALTEVEIPGNVKDIGEGAFYGCSSLVTLTLGEGVETLGEYAFSGCTSLTHGADGLYFPGSITTIGNWVLANCPGVTKVSLPGSLYTVGSPLDAVFGWSIAVTYRTDAPVFHFSASNEGQLVRVDPNGNTSITLPAEVKEVFWTSFTNCPAVTHVTVPGTVTNILTRAFANFGSLRTVTIQEGVETIESQAFYGCSNLAEVTVPDSVTSLGDSVFGGCASLGSAMIGNGVTEILQFMFYPCASLTNVSLGASVERIAYNAFWNCAALKDIYLPASLTLIENSAFWGCSSLGSVRIPEHATVQYFAFHSCTGLESVYIGKGATLQNNVFVGCTGIKSVNVAASEATPLRRKLKMMSASAKGMPLLGALSNPDATTLGDYAFYGCSDLESVALGSTVEDIGGGVFAGCPKLTTVTVEEGNDSYMAVDGMLLTKDGSTLVCAFGSETSVSVTSSVTRVSSGAFAGYAALTNVMLQSGVVTIGEAAFSNATAFATITIPSSVATIGVNAFFGTELATVYVDVGDTAHIKGLVEGTGYDGEVTYIEGSGPAPAPQPSIAGDSAATVTGNAEDGYTITPSATEGTVEVTIPSGLDAEKVTVEVPPTATVKPNGANVKVVNGANDITAFLNIPAANASGEINLNEATVKTEIVKEALDPTKEGVTVDLTPSAPVITTAPTRAGLTYTFSEGATLDTMVQKSVKVGDGTSWAPPITVKGGTSGFYSIGVTK